MKTIFFIILFFLFSRSTFAQQKLDYFLSDSYLEIDTNLEVLIQKFVNRKDTCTSLIFCYGFDLNEIIVLNLIDTMSYQKIYIRKGDIVSDGIIKVKDTNIYTFLINLNGEHFFLSSQNLSSHSNGYRYYVFKGEKVIASFYSFHSLNYYEIRNNDKEKLKLLFYLIDFFQIK